MRNVFKHIFTTMAIYYVLIGGIIVLSLNVDRITMARLNYLKESAQYPVLFLNNEAVFSQMQFRYARHYYQTLIDAVSLYSKDDTIFSTTTLSRAYNMLAICEYYLGNHKNVASYFKKALILEPRHYWLNYNLGVIAFESGDDSAALTYFKNSFSLTKNQLDESMHLDYFEFWEPSLGKKFKDTSTVQFYAMIKNSYKLSILAYDRMGQLATAKKLTLMVTEAGMGQQDSFYDYYKGISSQKVSPPDSAFKLMFNPSLYFVPVGQERLFVNRQVSERLNNAK
ncbi:MAG: tetratricopeptide repeat protein [Candidatus Omnitrophica bacterium]|nr:tetratricopeptide repeat protein [Candidatus Omnitrophota bacterium]